MLEAFRNAAKGWVAKLFMGLLVLSFAIWGIKDVGNGVADSGELPVIDINEPASR